jgi:LmbE family N-acetylglucosaminyl deacetylase
MSALQSGSALVIVAHPDDETIWMGGTILQNKNVNWTIFSLCRGDDPDREPKFKLACEYLCAKSIITNIEDDSVMNIKNSVPVILEMIKKNLLNNYFSYIFTHGANGEYGHPRHKGVYKAVKELIKTEQLSANKIFTFAYLPSIVKEIIASPKLSASMRNSLSGEIYWKKQYIMKTIYNFDPRTPDYKSSGKIETFDELKIKK